MKKLWVIITLIMILIIVSACSAIEKGTNSINQTDAAQVNTLGYVSIKPSDAKSSLENDKGIILLDVRTVEEYTEKHIPGSILIPVDELENKASEILPDKAAKIYVYCRSGRRAATASEALVEMGYTNVYNLGGIIDWPYETESGAPAK